MNECRDAFEKWAKTQGNYFVHLDYHSAETKVPDYMVWNAWQARQQEIDLLLKTMDIQTAELRNKQLEIDQLIERNAYLTAKIQDRHEAVEDQQKVIDHLTAQVKEMREAFQTIECQEDRPEDDYSTQDALEDAVRIAIEILAKYPEV